MADPQQDDLNIQTASPEDDLNIQNPDGTPVGSKPGIWDHIMAQLAAGAPGTYAKSATRLKAPQDLTPEEKRNGSKAISAIMGTTLMGPLAGLISGATTQTPGDAAATLAAGTLGGGKLNLGNRGYNAIAGLLRGFGMEKGADVARAAVDNKDMPSMGLDPASTIAAGLGGVGGLATGAQKPSAKALLADAQAAKDVLKPVYGNTLRERDAAKDAFESYKTATQNKLQDALTKAKEARDNAKVVGFEEFHNNQVAKAEADLADLQNKDFTQTDAGKRLAQAEANFAPVREEYTKRRIALAMAQRAAKNPDSDEMVQRLYEAAIHHGAGGLIGGLVGGVPGAVTGLGAQWLAGTPAGQKVVGAAPQLIPGLSNLTAAR